MSEVTVIDAGDLTPRDIGRQVKISHDGTTVTGQLTDLRVDTGWIPTVSLVDSDYGQVAGRQTVTLAVGPWVTTTLPLSARVEVQRLPSREDT
jgi:hypothetical protein